MKMASQRAFIGRNFYNLPAFTADFTAFGRNAASRLIWNIVAHRAPSAIPKPRPRYRRCRAGKQVKERLLRRRYHIPVVQTSSWRTMTPLLYPGTTIRPRVLAEVRMAPNTTITETDENSILEPPSPISEDFRNVSLESRQTQDNTSDDLHETPSCEAESLNIQSNTKEQIQPTQRTHYAPSLMVANVMSLIPKIDEV